MAYSTQRIYVVIFFALVLLTAQLVDAIASEQEVFLQADAAYKAGDLDQACALWHSLQVKNDHVYFNLARCMQKKGDTDRAYFYFRKARALSTASFLPTIDKALDELTQQQLSFIDIVQRYSGYAARYGSLGFWQLVILVSVAFGWVSLWYGYSRYRLLIFISVLFAGSVLLIRYRQLQITPGMITHDQTPLFIIPRSDVDYSAQLAVGTQIEILDKRGQWYKIRHHDTIGWVSEQMLCYE